MTLPSNASMDVFPNNTQSSYKIVLPRTLYLKHDYEVALAEIHYPVAWRTFSGLESYGFLVRDNDDMTIRHIFVPKAYYESVPEFVDAINKALHTHFEIEGEALDTIVINCNRLEQNVRVKTKSKYSLRFNSEASEALGLNFEWYTGPYKWGEFIYDITRGFNSLYVYCSLVAPQIVGNVYVPLLRSVAVEQKRGHHVIKAYGEPHYVPINSKEIHMVEINIKDDTGTDVSFTFGKVICKLHFRQRSL